MSVTKRSALLSFAVLAALIALLFSAAAAVEYSRAEVMEQSSQCLDCHEGKDASLATSVHRLSNDKDMTSQIAVGCISCHDGWEAHLEDPSEETMSSFTGLLADDQADVCGRCHVTVHQTAMVTTDVHSRAGATCTSCHRVHDNPNHALVTDDRADFCATCHTGVASEFKRRSAHPLESGNITCLNCHDFSGISDPMLAVGNDWTCQKCHTDVAGPYPYEHPVNYTHLVEGGGCTECHEPHGSPNDRLLKQPENGTCLQCHGVPPAHRTMHSGLGTKLACVDCHSEIHGSFDNGKLLDPMLGSKLFPDCFQSGCHIVNQ